MRILPVFAASLLCFTALSGHAEAGTGQALQIIVSKDLQRVTVYDGLDVVAQSKVSTGKPGHTTPSGIFSILEKRKFHRSNIYSNAPMPWMQRITWSGVALHESNSVPDYPASHGCVRLPAAFAKSLFEMTERGAHVIISDAEVTPQLLSGSALPKPQIEEAVPMVSDAPLRASIGSSSNETVEVAMNDPNPELGVKQEAQRDPIYILITRTSERDRVAEIQERLNAIGYDAGTVDGILGRLTLRAINDFRTVYQLTPGKGLDDDFVAALAARDLKGPIANGRVMIRENFKEIYSAGVTIDEPQKALGTHFMEARDVSPTDGTVNWYGVSLANHLSTREQARMGIIEQADDPAFNSATNALARIHMPEEARKKIATLMGEGSALTITDTGHQPETGLGTNFITLTRKAPQS
ncbi:L,D-transpeptidase family protein [Rhizobium sp. L1K21]|uniref:L,D-transpeptidase family protein n=1 Tax=Rhizobium sp. L1K21 TaxID=2954933 RepID=UPI002093DA84|nr:L,D-transpeptidase family protein [Rhizobium sp. L1K21]MCO6186014.1 L,D-transpeptidase family protein [Rhizobium sp. L1K21]